jgi:hypothetical protein
MDIERQALQMIESLLEAPSFELTANRKKQDVDAIRMAVLRRMASADCDAGELETSPVYRKPN